MFTTATLITSGILTGGSFDVNNAINFATLCFGFLTIVGGVALLFEYSLKLSRLEALARQNIAGGDQDRPSVDAGSQKSSALSLPLIDRASFSQETLSNVEKQ